MKNIRRGIELGALLTVAGFVIASAYTVNKFVDGAADLWPVAFGYMYGRYSEENSYKSLDK